METTDKWIEELKENAKNPELYKGLDLVVYSKGNLHCDDNELGITYHSEACGHTDKIALEGVFTIKQLKALLQHMKRYQE